MPPSSRSSRFSLPLLSQQPVHSTVRRPLVLVALDWTRDKDPRVPLGHASLLAALKRAQVPVQGLEFSVNLDEFALDTIALEIERAIASLSARGEVDVGIGAYVWNEPYLRPLMTTLRQRGFRGRFVLGGPQVSYQGIGLEALYPEANVFVRGYGEQALVAVQQTNRHDDIDGVHWAGQPDRVKRTEVDLERIPSPFLDGSVDVRRHRRFHRWETQRGCPFRCSFCQHREVGARLRRRDLNRERIEDEIRLFCAAGVQDIAVLDPIFNTGERATRILDSFRREGFKGRLSLQCRFEYLERFPGFLEACEGLNVRLEFGLQTTHEREGRAIKRVNDLARVDRAIRELHRRTINFEVSLIFGLPEQTLESFQASVDYCLRHKVPTIKAFPLMLLRGTPLDQERERWDLVENDDPIPAVIGSSRFDANDWAWMNAISLALAKTEGAHPPNVTELMKSVNGEQGDTARWSPPRSVA